MKQQLTVQELAAEITDRAGRKTDLVAPTGVIGISRDATQLIVQDRSYNLTKIAHEQIGEHAGIPRGYYERLRQEAPDLLGDNIRRWFDLHPAKRLVRVLEPRAGSDELPTARAVLSDKFLRLDDNEFASSVLPIIGQKKGAEITSCAITEEKTHIKFVVKNLEREIKVGDPVNFGIAFSNSEVGRGRLEAKLLINRLVCLNGAVVAEEGWARTHVGARQGKRDLKEIFQLDTVIAEGRADILKLRDFADQLLTDERIDSVIARYRETTTVQIKKPETAVQVLGKTAGLLENEQVSILQHFINGGDISAFGLQNAVTAFAQDKEISYDRAHELEQLGGKLINLKAVEWKEVLKEAA